VAVSPRHLLFVGTVLTALGLAVAMTSPHAGAAGYAHSKSQQILGGIVVLFGWATLAWGIHRFGRVG
jgi:hypothetical protein